MASETFPVDAPFILPYEGVEPRFATTPSAFGIGSSILGSVRLGSRAMLGPGSVIRADGEFVQIGDDFFLGEISTVHISPAICPTIIGRGVTIGRNAVIHACTIGDDCVIEDNVVILDGATVESGVLIEAGSTVFSRSKLPGGFVYSGNPAKQTRPSNPAEIQERAAILHGAGTTFPMPTVEKARDFEPDVFVALTAQLSGRVELRASSSVLFSCRLDAGLASLVVGENSNIQDNTVIKCASGDTAIGRDTTVGHNVQMLSCQIGNQSLIGIGSFIDSGTIVDDDVLLAAGSLTRQGQHLEQGWLWGGRPARPIAKLDDAKRHMMRAIVDQYRIYGSAYNEAQRHLKAQRTGIAGASTLSVLGALK